MVNKILFIGANSDFCLSVIDRLNHKENQLFCVSRSELTLDNEESFKINNYFDSLEQIQKIVFDNDINEVLLFNGYIYEGVENKKISNKQIKQTFEINFLLPCAIISKLNKLDKNIRFTVISSIATSKLRLKNYYYGMSKQALEDFILNQNKGKYLVFRSGFIFTKLTKLHRPPPFSLEKEEASFVFYKKFVKKQYKRVKFSYSSNSIHFLYKL